jgi:hypothetical protein
MIEPWQDIGQQQDGGPILSQVWRSACINYQNRGARSRIECLLVDKQHRHWYERDYPPGNIYTEHVDPFCGYSKLYSARQ